MAKLSRKYVDLESISLLSAAKIFSVDDFLLADIDKIVMNSKLTAEVCDSLCIIIVPKI